MNSYFHERTWSDCEAEIKQYLERLLWHDKLLLEKNDEIKRLRVALEDCQNLDETPALRAEIERLCQQLRDAGISTGRDDEKGVI